MNTYNINELKQRQEYNQQVMRNTYAPTIKDYIIWIMFPGILGIFTCGIGSIVLMIVWAADSKNMARANYFRAILILSAISILLCFFFGIIMFGSIGAMLGSLYT